MRYSTVMSHLAKEYERAMESKWIRKPISYALYQTWKWCDTYEKDRNEKKMDIIIDDGDDRK